MNSVVDKGKSQEADIKVPNPPTDRFFILLVYIYLYL